MIDIKVTPFDIKDTNGMPVRLSDYATSHMVLINIERRFETVIARHPKRNTDRMKWRIQHARMQGLHERNEFPYLLDRFDWALRS